MGRMIEARQLQKKTPICLLAEGNKRRSQEDLLGSLRSTRRTAKKRKKQERR
jgi:hypothetical protein